MSILDMIVDGVKVRDTDLTKFPTHTSLLNWRKQVVTALREVNNLTYEDAEYFDNLDAIDEFVAGRRDEIEAAAQARRLSMPPRNLDLVVLPQNDDDRPRAMKGLKAGEVRRLFDCFDTAEQMANYEFDAYGTLGDAECDRQGIETLHDMFGTEFAEVFYRKKNALIAREEIPELGREVARLQSQIERKLKIIRLYDEGQK